MYSLGNVNFYIFYFVILKYFLLYLKVWGLYSKGIFKFYLVRNFLDFFY